MNSGNIDITNFAPRDRILAAALKLFVEQGYFNTNVPDLSRESKCSVGSIYHTFKSKEDVARELYMESIKAFRGAIFGALHDEHRVEMVIKILVESFMEFSEINHQLSRYLWLCRHNEFLTGLLNHPTMVGFDPLGRKLAKIIKSGMRTGEIRVLESNVLWSIIFGIPLAYVRDWLDGYNDKKPSVVAASISDTCWRAIKAKDN